MLLFSDLSPLNNLPYLLILDASHNKLTTILDFTPPKNLKEVDLSFNEIEEMSDLSAHHCLAKLNLDSILYPLILNIFYCISKQRDWKQVCTTLDSPYLSLTITGPVKQFF